jgi:hypothetical protein
MGDEEKGSSLIDSLTTGPIRKGVIPLKDLMEAEPQQHIAVNQCTKALYGTE